MENMTNRTRKVLITLAVITGVICAIVLGVSKEAAAEDFHLVDLKELTLNYRNYALVNDHARNLLIYPEYPKEAINVGIKLDILRIGYWDSLIESLTTGSQYRGIGLDTRLGIRVTENVELGLWHHSQHVLDRSEGNIGKFASEDAVEIKVFLYKSPAPRNGIF
jgi:hypothetical protein